jgi:hypothetical protein
MIGQLLMRGLLAGLLAGLLTFGFAKLVGEPSVDRAIAFEQRAPGAARGETPEPELVSRYTQAGVGLLTAVVVYGTSVGGLFALVFAYAFGRVGKVSPRELSIWLALASFVALVLFPGLKYPATPPAVGEPETIAYRTECYFVMMLISVVTMGFVAKARSTWTGHLGQWNASLAAGVVYIAVMIVAMAALPRIDEVPATFPATLLWNFRIAALGMQAVLWTGLALIFGWMVDRAPAARAYAR